MSKELTDGHGRQLLNVEQVAEMVGCHPRHARRMADDGTMPPPLKIGKMVRWSKQAITVWIESGCPKQKETAT